MAFRSAANSIISTRAPWRQPFAAGPRFKRWSAADIEAVGHCLPFNQPAPTIAPKVRPDPHPGNRIDACSLLLRGQIVPIFGSAANTALGPTLGPALGPALA